VRFNEKTKNSPHGLQLEISCRLNIALCKQFLNEHDVVVDQCDRVLEMEPKNWKACFRISQALYQQTDGNSNLRAIYNYAKKAFEGNSNDKKVKELYEEIKEKFDRYNREQEA